MNLTKGDRGYETQLQLEPLIFLYLLFLLAG